MSNQEQSQAPASSVVNLLITNFSYFLPIFKTLKIPDTDNNYYQILYVNVGVRCTLRQFFSSALGSATIMAITACTHTCNQQGSKYRVCVQTGFCEGGCQQSCLLTEVSIKRASTVFLLLEESCRLLVKKICL